MLIFCRTKDSVWDTDTPDTTRCSTFQSLLKWPDSSCSLYIHIYLVGVGTGISINYCPECWFTLPFMIFPSLSSRSLLASALLVNALDSSGNLASAAPDMGDRTLATGSTRGIL